MNQTRTRPGKPAKPGFVAEGSADNDWRHWAECRDEDPELFFPVSETGPGALQVEDAKAVCRACPVSDLCLEWALGSGQEFGVWGELSADERRSLKRRTARERTKAKAAS